jgi:hypothetical protein
MLGKVKLPTGLKMYFAVVVVVVASAEDSGVQVERNSDG